METLVIRARLESNGLPSPDRHLSHSPQPTAEVGAWGDSNGLPPERDVVSPQLVEMHTFRDAIDVNYQRMALTGEELSGVPLEDLKVASKLIKEALQIRQDNMDRIGNFFPTTTRNFLTGEYPKNLPKCRRKNTEMCKWLRSEYCDLRMGGSSMRFFFENRIF
uniref:Uncharacterized protein n=1 Tax=Bursaphelenchus xylophilus TaxID=6326 RepID=A0A1I7SG43_BURXY